MENLALDLVQQYMNGWKQNNLSLITSCLTKNCIVIESHGPTYHGIEAIERWFKLWMGAKSSIIYWSLHDFYFCENKSAVFVEWDFACTSSDTKYSFSGCSLYKILNGKIDFIQEYRMTHYAYPWRGDTLTSE